MSENIKWLQCWWKMFFTLRLKWNWISSEVLFNNIWSEADLTDLSDDLQSRTSLNVLFRLLYSWRWASTPHVDVMACRVTASAVCSLIMWLTGSGLQWWPFRTPLYEPWKENIESEQSELLWITNCKYTLNMLINQILVVWLIVLFRNWRLLQLLSSEALKSAGWRSARSVETRRPTLFELDVSMRCLGTRCEFTAGLVFLTRFLPECGFRVWTWTLWSSSTSRSTRPPRWGDAPTAPTAASTPTWARRATSRWSWPRRSRSSPNLRRRWPRRKRWALQITGRREEVRSHKQTSPASVCVNAPTSRLRRLGWSCGDDHLGHLWMNHENKLLKSEQLNFELWRLLSDDEFLTLSLCLQVSQKKLKKQKLMAREWILRNKTENLLLPLESLPALFYWMTR